MRLTLAQRRLFLRDLPSGEFETVLAGTSVHVRQNVRRIFVAALLAAELEAPLAFVEGWRCHEIPRHGPRGPRLLTGSRISRLWLRMLQRRGLVPGWIRPIWREASRCTVDEVEAIAVLVPAGADAPRIVGIAGLSCPSAVRAERYLRRAAGHGSTVAAPAHAVARWRLSLDERQLGIMRATRLGVGETLRSLVVEGVNWAVHGASEIERVLRPSVRPLEQRLAHRLRADRPRP
jgi:hypothetical protein